MIKWKRCKQKKSSAVVVSNFNGDCESSKGCSSEVEALINEAEAAIDNFNYDIAESKLKEALLVDPSSMKLLEMLAGVYIEQLKWIEAQTLLKQCIELSPEVGFSKYFSMGQLYEGRKSISYYETGIKILEKNLENIGTSEEKNINYLRRNLSDAYCSVAEIYMTDCCFEKDAEKMCFTAIDAAIKSDPCNPEAYQCLASFHLVKEQFVDAKDAVQKSISLWLPQLEALRDDETFESTDENDVENLIPVYDSRIKTSKLLIELQMFEEATEVLNQLIDEDDEAGEVWYLLGWLNYLQGDKCVKSACFYLKKAKEVYGKSGMDDDECVLHVNELLKELNNICSLSDLSEEEKEEQDDLDLFSVSESDIEMKL